MMAPRNAYPACPVGQNDRTGVNSFSACLLAKSDRIGADRIDLLNRGHAIPMGLSSEFRPVPVASGSLGRIRKCAMLYALCAMLAVPLGVRPFSKQGSHKAPSSQKEGGAFLFCPVDFYYSYGAKLISPGASYGERSKRV